MHAGLPVVVSDHVGCAEDLVLPKQTGLQFPRDDVRALQDALGWLCDVQQGMQRRAQLGMAARAHIATWTYEQATAGLLFALQQVCPKRA
jgi:glycosyltransferase involved in cell wall biosynthesis